MISVFFICAEIQRRKAISGHSGAYSILSLSEEEVFLLATVFRLILCMLMIVVFNPNPH
jgi:hypothetical protein